MLMILGISIVQDPGSTHIVGVAAEAIDGSWKMTRSRIDPFVSGTVESTVRPIQRIVRDQFRRPVYQACCPASVADRIAVRRAWRTKVVGISVPVFIHVHLQRHTHLTQAAFAGGGVRLSLGQ